MAASKTPKNMRLDSDLVQRLQEWADAHGLSYAAATEAAMRALLDAPAPTEGAVDAATADLIADGADPDTMPSVRDLMIQNGELISQLAKANETAMAAVAKATEAVTQLRMLPSPDEVDMRVSTAAHEATEKATLQATKEATAAERERIKNMGWFRRMTGNF